MNDNAPSPSSQSLEAEPSSAIIAEVIAPGSTIGILGGGQLARMLAMAAARLGYVCHVYAPEADSPAFDIAARHTQAPYDDEAALAAFAARCAVVTYEFENIPVATAAFLAGHGHVRPAPEVLAATQDRLIEKRFLNSLGLATTAFAPVEDVGALAHALARIGRPAILKTRRMGYDGKGQVRVEEGSDLAAIIKTLGGSSAILEGVVPFQREISVIAARNGEGEFAAFDPCENIHQNQILSRTLVPAGISAQTAMRAIAMTQEIAEALDYVGVLAVEIFVTQEGSGERVMETLRINEIAPRVHNSGHWTIEGALTSQFEQHIRAICGLPLGSTQRLGQIVMDNLIGEEWQQWPHILQQKGAALHLYGKSQTRQGRKMGHVTRVLPES